jgi:hypothetical protein
VPVELLPRSFGTVLDDVARRIDSVGGLVYTTNSQDTGSPERAQPTLSRPQIWGLRSPCRTAAFS